MSADGGSEVTETQGKKTISHHKPTHSKESDKYWIEVEKMVPRIFEKVSTYRDADSGKTKQILDTVLNDLDMIFAGHPIEIASLFGPNGDPKTREMLVKLLDTAARMRAASKHEWIDGIILRHDPKGEKRLEDIAKLIDAKAGKEQYGQRQFEVLGLKVLLTGATIQKSPQVNHTTVTVTPLPKPES